MLAVHPKDRAQCNALRQLKTGSAIELIIQLDPESKRRILVYHDRSQKQAGDYRRDRLAQYIGFCK